MNIFVIFITLLLYFVLKMIYNIVILVVIAKLFALMFAKVKAKGQETIKEFETKINAQKENDQDGEKR